MATPPPAGTAAIAAIELRGDVEGAMARLGIRPVGAGGVALRDLAGVDEGVVARFSGTLAFLMPHAGAAVVRSLIDRIVAAGLREDREPDPLAAYPEASSPVEARMLAAMARAQSPLAVDLLLDQPRRWAVADEGAERDGGVLARSRVLKRLIDPPLVVALGRPNIGKSTLLNTLAGRPVAIVADQPGTTRDHVGVTLDLAGLVVRWIDAPGLADAPADPVDAEAQRLAIAAAGSADLVLLCADATAPFPAIPPGFAGAVLRVGLRSDLGPPADGPVACAVSRDRPESVEALVGSVREALVPAAAIGDPGPWQFW
jgi:hypothetical protein